MQVVILAGGKGSRLKPLTDTIPKPMIPINGKPFLQYQLEYIRSKGLDEVLILAGYLSEKIIEYFEDGSGFDLRVSYSIEDEPLGTGGALRNAGDILAREFLLLNGDTFLPIDYNKFLYQFHLHNTLSSITAYSNPELIVNNNMDIGESGLVIKYDKRVSKGLRFVDAGAIVFKKDVLDLIPGQGNCSLEEEVFQQLINRKEMVAYVTEKKFYDMGTIEGIHALEKVLK